MSSPYVPVLMHPPPANIGSVGQYFGHGSPEGVQVGFLGETYVDQDAGQLYFKASDDGENTGWVLSADGGGGTTECFHGTGIPEGAQVGSVGNYYWRTSTASQYVKQSGSGNTGWILLSGPG